MTQKTFGQRKAAIALISVASVAVGSGIWSMHFVAMLGMQMPTLFYYDAAITLAPALLAILIVGSTLILWEGSVAVKILTECRSDLAVRAQREERRPFLFLFLITVRFVVSLKKAKGLNNINYPSC